MKQFILRTLSALSLLSILASPAWAVLARDTTAQNIKDGTGTTLDIAYTATGTSTDGALFVLCVVSTSGATTITGIEGNQGGSSEPLTQHTTLDATNISVRLDIWRRLLPSTGSKTVRVTTSVAQPTACTLITYTGVNQTTPLGTAVTDDNTTGTATSVDVSCASGSFAIDIAAMDVATGTLTVGADQTQLGTAQINTQNDTEVVSEEAGAATNTMSWSWVSTSTSASVGVCVNAATATTTGVVRRRGL